MTVETMEVRERKHQIPDQLDILNGELSQLGEIIDDLKVQLQPVLREPMEAKTSPPKDEEKLVDLAGVIRDCKERVSRATTEIVSVLQLLEL